MGYFHLERGRLVDILIDFVWYIAEKVDLLDRAGGGGGTFQIRRIREGLFEGQYGIISGTIELISVDPLSRIVKLLI